MKPLNYSLIFFILLLQLQVSSAQDLTGHFYLDAEAIDVRIENKSKKIVILEGLNERLLSAKFFSRKNDEVGVKRKGFSNVKSFQNWTRLLAASPDGGNPGSNHRLLLRDLVVPQNKREEVAYLTFVAKVLVVKPDRRLTLAKEMKIRLVRKLPREKKN